ncbi:hypothetical protein GCM10025864_31480 [Luteimicrobium album]|uniref:Mannitol dehydrogenase C-terminal domain-containing protein n=1 Tax=Luteimicrobium album TaxID=1054550 RepID=A0ABQ6I3R2_9MICO|nr:hypothetical protein GCM10025864_31480 [Luteimicrobium album]
MIRANLAANRDVTLSAAVVAAWARYAEGVDEHGEPIEVVDRLADRLTAVARTQRDDPLAFVRADDLFGDLAADPRFTTPYLEALGDLHTVGARALLERLVPDAQS